METVVYHNLGASKGSKMMYIRSTDIEQMNWVDLMLSFPDEALYHLCKGRKILIKDRCNKSKGKVERIFTPVMSDFLRLLRGVDIKHKNLIAHLTEAVRAYQTNKHVKRKYKFFKDKINSTLVVGQTIRHEKEPSVWDKIKKDQDRK